MTILQKIDSKIKIKKGDLILEDPLFKDSCTGIILDNKPDDKGRWMILFSDGKIEWIHSKHFEVIENENR